MVFVNSRGELVYSYFGMTMLVVGIGNDGWELKPFKQTSK